MDKAQEEFMSLLKYDKFCQSLKMILKFSNNVGNMMSLTWVLAGHMLLLFPITCWMHPSCDSVLLIGCSLVCRDMSLSCEQSPMGHKFSIPD